MGKIYAHLKKEWLLATAIFAALVLITITPFLWHEFGPRGDVSDRLVDAATIYNPTQFFCMTYDSIPKEDINSPQEIYEQLRRLFRGVWNGNIWTNEYIGLFFYLPERWEYASDDEIASMIGFDTAPPPGSERMTNELWEMADAVLYDMWAFNLEEGHAVLVLFEMLPDPDFGVGEFIEFNVDLLRHFETNVNIDVEPRLIGGIEWAGFELYSDTKDIRYNIIHFVSLIDGFAVKILVQIFDNYGKDVDDFIRLFGYIGDAPAPSWNPFGSIMRGIMIDGIRLPSLGEPDISHPLVGSWAWDLDSGFVYNFLEDGTGTRGFPWNIETFTWESTDEHLVIRLLIMDESWTFSVSGIELTIENRQAPGMTWRYIRQ